MKNVSKSNSQINNYKTVILQNFACLSQLIANNYSVENGFKIRNGEISITLLSTLQCKGGNLQPCAWPHIRSVTGYGIYYVNSWHV